MILEEVASDQGYAIVLQLGTWNLDDLHPEA